MFLNALILVLQEMIEASLLISVLLVFTHLFQKSWDKSFVLHMRWVVLSIAMGSLGAAVYSATRLKLGRCLITSDKRYSTRAFMS
jgi:hypothetical protein